jgi:hypothetical protein
MENKFEGLQILSSNYKENKQMKLFFYLFIHNVGTLFGSCLQPAPVAHPLPSSPPQFQAGPVLPLSLILLKKRHKQNKEDKAFLLVELRIVMQMKLLRKLLILGRMFTSVDTQVFFTLSLY